MVKIIKGSKSLPKQNDCGCGKQLKVNDPRRKKNNIKRIIKKKF
jgi:hypothetical protein